MSSNEMIAIVVCVVFGVLLFSGVMFRFALYYRDQVKTLKKQVQDLQEENRKKEFKFLKESKQTIDECDDDLKKYEEQIKGLKQQIDEYEAAFKWKNEIIDTLEAEYQLQDAEIERLTQELKRRGEAVKEKPHKNKKKSK
ncbi:hypothetical protein [Bartonella queenslandensis]|uniref:hypothetical protein n=1 Tax=Bartonella queenslandensis TaxID=481138 RepID=UPI000584B37E|nr:hypothetical protein [Bartonella queenslandensis]